MSIAKETALAARSDPSVPTATVLICSTPRAYFSPPAASGKLVSRRVAKVARRMARDWSELFIVDGTGPAADSADQAEPEEQRVGRFRRLRENLRKTRQALTSEIQA